MRADYGDYTGCEPEGQATGPHLNGRWCKVLKDKVEWGVVFAAFSVRQLMADLNRVS
jgi:hypothetical protein